MNEPTTLTPGTTYLSRDGSTSYTVVSVSDRPGHRGVTFRVRLREFGWTVSNPRAHFRFRHVMENVETGIWTLTDAEPATEATEATEDDAINAYLTAKADEPAKHPDNRVATCRHPKLPCDRLCVECTGNFD